VRLLYQAHKRVVVEDVKVTRVELALSALTQLFSTSIRIIMLRSVRIPLRKSAYNCARQALTHKRCVTTAHESVPKKEGDISSVFRSLSGGDEEALPQRFADVKRSLVHDKDALHASWVRLLRRLKDETEVVKAEGSACIPNIEFSDLDKPTPEFNKALRKRGVAIVRQVVPEKDAREFKNEIEKYVATNPSTKGKR
jgi:hypothetical protein